MPMAWTTGSKNLDGQSRDPQKNLREDSNQAPPKFKSTALHLCHDQSEHKESETLSNDLTNSMKPRVLLQKQFLSLSKHFLYVTELQSSFPFSQQPPLFSCRSINFSIFSPTMTVFQVASFLQISPPKPCRHLSFTPHMPHSLPITFTLSVCHLLKQNLQKNLWYCIERYTIK